MSVVINNNYKRAVFRAPHACLGMLTDESSKSAKLADRIAVSSGRRSPGVLVRAEKAE